MAAHVGIGDHHGPQLAAVLGQTRQGLTDDDVATARLSV
jgi:hypothetical protein